MGKTPKTFCLGELLPLVLTKAPTVLQDTQERAPFDKFWQGLSASDQHALETQAMQEVDVLTLSVRERLQGKGGKMWEEVRLSIHLSTTPWSSVTREPKTGGSWRF